VDDVRQFEAALDQAGVPNEISIYENQPHAFVTDIESIRLGGVQGEAWAQMLAFLDQHLKQDGASQHRSALSHTAPEWSIISCCDTPWHCQPPSLGLSAVIVGYLRYTSSLAARDIRQKEGEK
jgi:hypothetical protein